MITAVANPYQSPLRWDYIECAGLVSPGVIPRGGMTGFDRVYNFAMQMGYGMYGADLTFGLRPPAEGEFRIWTWTAEQYEAMGPFLSVLEYDPTKQKVQAIDIFYPALAMIGIRRVVTMKISPPKHQGGKKYEWVLGFKEFRPPPKISAVSTPVQTKKKPIEDDPDLDQQIEKLQPQYEKAMQDGRAALGV